MKLDMDSIQLDVNAVLGQDPETNKERKVDSPSSDDNLFLKPFDAGWKREVVMRVITDAKRPACDIYYFHPDGRKLRSLTEVKANLTGDLTLDNFTFKKEPLNVDAETVRNARIRGKVKAIGKKAKPLSTKLNSTAKAQSTEKPTVEVRQGSKRQSMKRKKERLRAVMNAKATKQTKVVPEKNSRLKRDSGNVSADKIPDNELCKKCKKESIKPSKKSTVKGSIKKRKSSKVKSSKSTEKQSATKDKRTGNDDKKKLDLKSIVQKNIVKYREMREKQLQGKPNGSTPGGSPTGEKSRHRSKPISEKFEIYMEPLNNGWRRELVHRVNGAGTGQSDVYYFHPNGKKFRSTREVNENLTPDLSLDNFTFRKEPIGCGEPMEIIRNARSNQPTVHESRNKPRPKKK